MELEKIYSNLKNPGGLSSIQKLYTEVKKHNPDIRKKDIIKFLNSKESYTLHRGTPNRFPRRKFLFTRPGHTLMADICYMKLYENENTPFLLFLMDGYSRYLTIYPISSLKYPNVATVLDNFFNNSIYKYIKFFTDQGIEFTNSKTKKMYEKHSIHWYTTFSKTIKVSPVERVILTIKNKIKKYISHFNTERYLDVLDKIVEGYNKSQHRMLDMRTPIDVHLLNKWPDIKRLTIKIYKRHMKTIKSVSNELPLGQVVRIQASRHTFSRALDVRNTYELFKVTKVNRNHIPTTYNLSDLDGDVINGVFYRPELTPVEDKGLYSIEILKTRKRKGKKQYLIRYVNFPASSKKWVNENMLVKLN